MSHRARPSASLRASEQGATTLEYILLGALCGLGCALAWLSFREDVSTATSKLGEYTERIARGEAIEGARLASGARKDGDLDLTSSPLRPAAVASELEDRDGETLGPTVARAALLPNRHETGGPRLQEPPTGLHLAPGSGPRLAAVKRGGLPGFSPLQLRADLEVGALYTLLGDANKAAARFDAAFVGAGLAAPETVFAEQPRFLR